MGGWEVCKSTDYRIEMEQVGREGTVFYIEESRLPFDWEILGGTKGGAGLTIPAPKEWDMYCEKNKATWAKGRRDEIIQKVAQALANNWYKNGTFEIDQDIWLNIYPGPNLLTRLLNKLGLE